MKDVALRIGAVFILGALGTIGAASLFDINPIIGAGIAGLLAAQEVIRDLAKAFLDDGKLSKREINEVFNKAMKKKDKNEPA
jgi:hypothetical protein